MAVLKLSTNGVKIFSVNESQINKITMAVLKLSTTEENVFSVNELQINNITIPFKNFQQMEKRSSMLLNHKSTIELFQF